MFKQLLILSLVYISVFATGDVSFLHHPESIIFKGHDHLDESLLKEVYSAALGYSVEQSSNWPGMYLVDPFHLAKAIVSVAVDGVVNLGEHSKGHHYPLRTDEDYSHTFKTLSYRIRERNPGSKSNLIEIDLGQGLAALQDHQLFADIQNVKAKKPFQGHLKLGIEEDHEFLQQVSLLNAISAKIEKLVMSQGQSPDVYFFIISGLHAVSDLHGENSTATKEAKQILNEAILRLNDAFKAAYKDSILFTVVTSDASHTRKTRSLLEAKADDPFANLNLSKDYSPDYPVIFNIILWFGIVMVFSLLAISLAIANMDPGRDSIIYRMTSNRMKKEN